MKNKGRANVIEGRTESRHKKRLRFYIVNVLLGFVIFVVASVLLILVLFPFKEIRVEGNTFYDDAVYTPYVVTDDYSFNTIYIMIKTMFDGTEPPEFVDDIKLSIEKRTTILVTVTEKTWSGYCAGSDGNYVYFDEEGTVVEVSERLIEGKPEVIGLIVEGAEEGQPLPVDNTIRRNITQLQEYMALEQVAYESVYFNSDGTITVFIDGGNIQISLGTSNLLKEKIRRLPYILPQIQGMTGILHIEDWTEDSTDIVFEKR